MTGKKIKQFLLPNLPYLFLFWLFSKLGEAYRVAMGADTLKKLVSAVANLNKTFSNPAPTFDPFDMLIGLIGAVGIYLMVLYKKNHSRKWRKDIEFKMLQSITDLNHLFRV
ncbi:MAG: conjugal transfer protein TraG [Lachnospiraceae bacterium]|jgi:type IV secretion system protein VirD4|nr:conjugal transfer protein TraG [Lachnospiraceae bacterium]